MKFTGRIIFTKSFDAGGNIAVDKITSKKEFKIKKIKTSKRMLAPRYISPAPDLEIKLPPTRIRVKWEDNIETDYYVSLLATVRKAGVVTLHISIPFKKINIDKLIDISTIDERDIQIRKEEMPFYEWAETLFVRVYEHIKEAIYNERAVRVTPEDYAFIIIDKISPKLTSKELYYKYPRLLAGLLLSEPYWRQISEQEKEDTLSSFASYTTKDLTIVGFDKSVLIGTGEMTNDIISVLNLANIHRLVLRVYEEILKQAITEAKEKKVWSVWRAFLPATWTSLYKIGTIQLDVTRLVGELKSETAYGEDYFLGKIYTACERKLQLSSRSDVVQNYLEVLQKYNERALNARSVVASLLVEISFILIMVTLWIAIG